MAWQKVSKDFCRRAKMNDQERYKTLEATVKLLEKQGRPVSGRELLDFYAATTDSTIKLQQLNWNLKKLEKEGFVTAKFMEDNGVVNDVQNIEVTGKVTNNFENERNAFFNSIWAKCPNWLKASIFLILVIGAVWSAIKFVPEMFSQNNSSSLTDQSMHQSYESKSAVSSERQSGGITAQTVNQSIFLDQDQNDSETILFIAQQVWIETKGNLSELKRLSAELSEGKTVSHYFGHDAYDKYGERLSRSTAAQQIVNFYEQIKRIERGVACTPEIISETIGQGSNVLYFLEKDFGIKDYYSNVENSESHVASADTVTVRNQ